MLTLLVLSALASDPGACDAEEPLCSVPISNDAGITHATDGLVFYWGVGCPRCEDAKPFVDDLEQSVEIERVEVRGDAEGRRRFAADMKRLGVRAAGVPTFVYGERYVVGYRAGITEQEVSRMLLGQSEDVRMVDLPWVGTVDTRDIPLGTFTFMIGLIDGVNPCAMWVLTVLLGILTHTRSRKRLLAYGFVFVLMSGLVYLLFMTAWTGLFAIAGISRWVSVALGMAVAVMGIINLKEIFWFKRGVSLTISDRAKPALYKRMRSIAGTARFPAALAGIVTLAFFANLIELGCTIGLPAVYTRILSLRTELGTAARGAYLVLYNTAYVVPLASIVIIYALTFHRLTLGERGAKVLKGISGVLLLAFGIILIAAPEILSGS